MEDYRFVGPFYCAIGLAHVGCDLQYTDTEIDKKIGGIAEGIGWGFFGVSFYVMRGESLPPRKNVFSRALDKIDELVEEYKRTLAPQPVRTE